MTRRRNYNLNPDIGKVTASFGQLEALRAHPSYEAGELIDQAAALAFATSGMIRQGRRRAVPRGQQVGFYARARRQAEAVEVHQAPELPTGILEGYTTLCEALAAVAIDQSQTLNEETGVSNHER